MASWRYMKSIWTIGLLWGSCCSPMPMKTIHFEKILGNGSSVKLKTLMWAIFDQIHAKNLKTCRVILKTSSFFQGHLFRTWSTFVDYFRDCDETLGWSDCHMELLHWIRWQSNWYSALKNLTNRYLKTYFRCQCNRNRSRFTESGNNISANKSWSRETPTKRRTLNFVTIYILVNSVNFFISLSCCTKVAASSHLSAKN